MTRWVMYHRGGCDKECFSLPYDPYVGGGVAVRSRDVLYPDGTHPEIGSYMVCGSCKEKVGFLPLTEEDR